MTETRTCACGNEITRSNPRFRYPTKCEDCRSTSTRATRAPAVVEETPETSGGGGVDVVAMIATLGLDYCVGSAVRFLMEYRDGDELANLRTAREYLDRAIVAREQA